MGRPPQPIAETFFITEFWNNIFRQAKPSFGGYIGLDLVQVRAVLKVYGVELTEELYEQIIYIEGKYIKFLNKESKDG